jgi:hypothetical protein
MKRCSKCKEEKPSSEFYRNKVWDCLQSYCKKCEKEHKKDHKKVEDAYHFLFIGDDSTWMKAYFDHGNPFAK